MKFVEYYKNDDGSYKLNFNDKKMIEEVYWFKVVAVSVGVLVALIVFLSSWTTVGAGQRGVMLTWGKVGEVYGEGLHFKTPVIQKMIKIDVRTQKKESTADAASKDLQSITTSVAINYHIDPSSVNNLYQEVGPEYEERLISPAIEESVKAITAQFTAEELITKRAEVKQKTLELIAGRLAKNYIIADNFSITNFSFSPEFDKAIESKQTAVQEALKAENELVRIRTEADQKVVQAQAEAERIRIQAESISNQGGAEYVRLKAIERWDGKLPVQMIPGSTVPFINLK